MDPSERRELNNGAGAALERAMELVVTPMIFGFFGWLLDRWLGTWPVFTLVFWAVVLACIVWKHTKLYGAAMADEQRRILGEKPEPT